MKNNNFYFKSSNLKLGDPATKSGDEEDGGGGGGILPDAIVDCADNIDVNSSMLILPSLLLSSDEKASLTALVSPLASSKAALLNSVLSTEPLESLSKEVSNASANFELNELVLLVLLPYVAPIDVP